LVFDEWATGEEAVLRKVAHIAAPRGQGLRISDRKLFQLYPPGQKAACWRLQYRADQPLRAACIPKAPGFGRRIVTRASAWLRCRSGGRALPANQQGPNRARRTLARVQKAAMDGLHGPRRALCSPPLNDYLPLAPGNSAISEGDSSEDRRYGTKIIAFSSHVRISSTLVCSK
jgi:hypothetical protein